MVMVWEWVVLMMYYMSEYPWVRVCDRVGRGTAVWGGGWGGLACSGDARMGRSGVRLLSLGSVGRRKGNSPGNKKYCRALVGSNESLLFFAKGLWKYSFCIVPSSQKRVDKSAFFLLIECFYLARG